jgi:hypothetical protein
MRGMLRHLLKFWRSWETKKKKEMATKDKMRQSYADSRKNVRVVVGGLGDLTFLAIVFTEELRIYKELIE